MNIVFRVDSSNIIGTGHVYRCLNLAHQYKDNNIFFICKNHYYNLNYKIAEKYKVFELNLEESININLDINTWLGESEIQDAEKTILVIKNNNLKIDWLIIDHYAINEVWENKLNPYVKNICVIDDFTNRPHNCNILINQQISYEEGLIRYKDCKLYCGNDYLLLHPKYFEYINLEKNYRKKYIEKINIFMGGADNNNITEKLIIICNEYNKTLQNKIIFDVIIGNSNKNYEKIKNIIKKLENFELYYNLDFIGDLLGKADLCIGAPGSTSYERCLMKTPSLCICIADNQKTVLNKFIDSNTIKYLGTINDNYEEKIIEYLNYFNQNIKELEIMAINCNNLINIKNNKIKYILN